MNTTRKVQDRTRTLSDLRAEVEALQTAQSSPVATVEELTAQYLREDESGNSLAKMLGLSVADVKRMAEASHKKLVDARERGNAERISELLEIIGIKEIPESFTAFVRGIFKSPVWATIKSKIPGSKGNKVVFTVTVNVDSNEVTACTVSFPRKGDTPSVSA